MKEVRSKSMLVCHVCLPLSLINWILGTWLFKSQSVRKSKWPKEGVHIKVLFKCKLLSETYTVPKKWSGGHRFLILVRFNELTLKEIYFSKFFWYWFSHKLTLNIDGEGRGSNQLILMGKGGVEITKILGERASHCGGRSSGIKLTYGNPTIKSILKTCVMK